VSYDADDVAKVIEQRPRGGRRLDGSLAGCRPFCVSQRTDASQIELIEPPPPVPRNAGVRN